MSMEKRNLVEGRRTPDPELKQKRDLIKEAAAEFKPAKDTPKSKPAPSR